MPPTDPPSRHRRGLIITAAPAETRAVLAAAGLAQAAPGADWIVHRLNDRWSLVQSGVGTVNAALCAAQLVDPAVFSLVVGVGVCGTLPGPSPLELLDLVLASRSVYADEGIDTGAAFIDMAAAGFGPGGVPSAFEGVGVDTDAAIRELLTGALTGVGLRPRVGPVATVSTCSGTEALARAVAARTGALAEAMEGAAIAHALCRMHTGSVAFAELRVVSNTTGDRARQKWNLAGALATLTAACRAVITVRV